jgi:hypothetical protein
MSEREESRRRYLQQYEFSHHDVPSWMVVVYWVGEWSLEWEAQEDELAMLRTVMTVLPNIPPEEMN